MGGTLAAELETLMRSTIDRFAPEGSVYRVSMEAVFGQFGDFNRSNLPRLRGILLTLKSDIENGYLEQSKGLLRAEAFQDVLDSAQYLNEAGFIPQALGTSRVVLETHLRELSRRNNLATARPDGTPLRASALNDALHGKGVYSTASEHQLVLSWLSLGNDASHPIMRPSSEAEAKRTIAAIREFIGRYPA